jgi:hypothetical protein
MSPAVAIGCSSKERNAPFATPLIRSINSLSVFVWTGRAAGTSKAFGRKSARNFAQSEPCGLAQGHRGHALHLCKGDVEARPPIVIVHGLRYTPDQKAVAEIHSEMEALARRIGDIPVHIEPVNMEAIGTSEERERAASASKDAQFQRFIGRVLPGQLSAPLGTNM